MIKQKYMKIIDIIDQKFMYQKVQNMMKKKKEVLFVVIKTKFGLH